jgi:xylulokinase
MADDPILVLDLGTTSVKAAHVGRDGRLRGWAERTYAHAPAPHRQDQEDWWRAVCAAVADLGPARPAAITFSGAMENLVPVDEAGMPCGPAILYSDPCGEPFCAEAGAALAAIDAAATLGNAPEPLMTAFKIRWLASSAPEVLAAARWLLLSPKDALILRLTGRAVADPTTATTSGLMDLARRQWSEPLLAALAIERARLPEILPSNAVVGGLAAGPARQLGLPTGVPVINGCGDAGAATLGAGCEDVGDISVYLGTSGWVARVVSDAGIAEPRPCYRLAHPAPGRLIEVVPVLAAGECAAWARRTLGLDPAEADAAALAADREPPALVFLPYLAGERAPEVHLDARGGFLGLSSGHGAGELYLAVLEGVAFAIARNLEALTGGASVERPVCLTGGGARSAVWPQVVADVLNAPVVVPPEPTFATSAGAAALAGAALPAREGRVVHPRSERRARLERLAAVFAEGTRLARSIRLESSP